MIATKVARLIALRQSRSRSGGWVENSKLGGQANRGRIRGPHNPMALNIHFLISFNRSKKPRTLALASSSRGLGSGL